MSDFSRPSLSSFSPSLVHDGTHISTFLSHSVPHSPLTPLHLSYHDRPYQKQDIYLYYFLLRYPGRTLVFLASVDGIRRMLPLFELLGLPVWPLHSQMEQRQRLKNLDRCVSSSFHLFPLPLSFYLSASSPADEANHTSHFPRPSLLLSDLHS